MLYITDQIRWRSLLRYFFVLLRLSRPVIAAIILFTLTANISAMPEQQQIVSAFQPTRASIYGTFYYPWYRNPAVDGRFAFWEGNSHSPPSNWNANFLPVPPGAYNAATGVINPAVGLYSSLDQNIFYWQISQMAQAHLEVSISSWWGRSSSPTSQTAGQFATSGGPDYVFRQIITNWMNRADNPYPNLRWALYYEKEGFANPTVAEITSDLQYINANYVNQPAHLQVNGRPVIFVYADATDGCAMVNRWLQARAQSGVNFYLVLKLFSGYLTCASQPDSWHQYAPAVRSGTHSPHSAFISPGFWNSGETPRLARNLTDFENAAAVLVSANAQWKLIETWNEWGEGTSVEPGIQVQQTVSGTAVTSVNGAPFQNAYVDVLSRWLPPLQAGTGAGTTVIPMPSSTTVPLSPTTSVPASQTAVTGSVIFGAGGDIGANYRSDASLRAIPTSVAQFFLALGDADYDETSSDQAWCDYVRARVGANFPFQLVTGNHEEGSSTSPGPDGYIENMTACLPDRLGVQPLIPGRPGYAANYYFDYPHSNPIMRVIMISPDLLYAGVDYQFNRTEQTNYNALAAAIDSAKQSGRWVVVGMHKNCITAGTKSCEIGVDLMNLLIQRRVDLVLQGHDHSYQRSRQLALGASCAAIVPGAYNPGCVVDDGSDNSYTRGAGTIIVINGNVGRCCYSINMNDSEAGYFARLVGTDGVDTSGFVVYTVSAGRLDARIVNAVGTYGDSFSILGNPPPPSTPTLSPTAPLPTVSPTTTPAPATSTPTGQVTSTPVVVGNTVTINASEDAYVNSSNAGSNYGRNTSIRTDRSPVVRSYLRFVVPSLNGSIARATLRIYATSSASAGMGYSVQSTGSNWTEMTLNYNNAPAVGNVIGSTAPVIANTWTSVDLSAYITVPGTYDLVLTSNDNRAVSYSSRESANSPQLELSVADESVSATVPSRTTPTLMSTVTPTITPTASTQAPAQTLSFNALADAYVNQAVLTTNYGRSLALRIDGSPMVNTYLNFNVQGVSGPVTNAVLRIYANSSTTTGFDVWSVVATPWTESTITFSNAPALESIVRSSGAFSANTWVTLDVTSLVSGNGTLSLGLTGSNDTAISLSSREGANVPQLLVEVGGATMMQSQAMELAASSIIGPENATLVDSTSTAATSEVPTAVTTVELSPLLTDTSQNFSGTPTAQAFPTVDLALPVTPQPTVTEMYLDQMTSTPFPTLPILGPSMPTVVAPDEVLPTPTMEFPIVSPPLYDSMDTMPQDWQVAGLWTLNAAGAYNGVGLGWWASGGTENILHWAKQIDLRNVPNAHLLFSARVFGEDLPLIVEVSATGSPWAPVYSVMPATDWQFVDIDLSGYYGQIVQVRFVWLAQRAESLALLDEVMLLAVDPVISVATMPPGPVDSTQVQMSTPAVPELVTPTSESSVTQNPIEVQVETTPEVVLTTSP
ncbi:MAG: DNRLRE domain-containing protein [Chloroflexi bacterium]|uniref:CBM96 family carbohydrate-binding protein n=1 Tax=Candidatus Flexifilum breve TaxID=3140694 RepID=UPI003134A1CD|nr:DNRLRE domain-containing protein [Chloroflexota bacterium]